MVRRALVVGCAANVFDDVAEARKLGEFDAIYCVKMAGIHWPDKFDCWVTLHPEFMDDYEAQRHKLGFSNGYQIIAPLPKEVGQHGNKGNVHRRVSYRWPGMNASASSGGYAAKVALDDGFDRVVLAGVPMTPAGGHAWRNTPWNQCGAFTEGFKKSVPFFKGRVKSISGWTKQILGAPTPEWLAERQA